MRKHPLTVLATAAVFVGCTQTQAVNELSDRDYSKLIPSGAIVSADTLPLLTIERALKLPNESRFRLSRPIAIAVAEAPACVLAVADRVDRAVHLFNFDGTYRRSISDGGTDTTDMNYLYSLDITAGGEILIYDRHTASILRYDTNGTRLAATEAIVEPTVQKWPGRQVLLLDGGLIVDNWFAAANDEFSEGWNDSLPQLQLIDSSGRRVGTLGSLEAYSGDYLPAALNRGIAARYRDSVLFVRRSDARAFMYPASAGAHSAARTFDLATFYITTKPYEYYRSDLDRGFTVIEDHVHGLAVDADGTIYVSQSTSYPRNVEGALFRPRMALMVYDPTGRPHAGYRMEHELRGIGLIGPWLALQLYDQPRSTHFIGLVRNPRKTASVNPSCKSAV